MMGQNKVLQKDVHVEEEKLSSKVAVINELLRGSLPGKQKELLKIYLSMHKDDIKSECADSNLFASPSLRGMGVTLPLGFKTKYTLDQRIAATKAYLRAGPHASLWKIGAGLGPEYPVVKPVRPPWYRGEPTDRRVKPLRVRAADRMLHKGLLKRRFMSMDIHYAYPDSPYERSRLPFNARYEVSLDERHVDPPIAPVSQSGLRADLGVAAMFEFERLNSEISRFLDDGDLRIAHSLAVGNYDESVLSML